jgi:hypothetical protein
MIDQIGRARRTQMEAEYTEDHFHNKVRWYTKKTAQSATAWASPFEGNLANFWRVISGNSVWGVDGSHDPTNPPSDEAYLFGTADTLTELGTGLTFGDFDKILIVANSSSTVYLVRFIWGTGTMGDAITAKQYTEAVFLRATGDSVRKVYDMKMPKVEVNDKLWAQCANATDNATLDFILGVHAYNF